MSAPITEEDKPAVASMIAKLKRYRKREHAQGKKYFTELDDAITALVGYGVMKQWWDEDGAALQKGEKG